MLGFVTVAEAQTSEEGGLWSQTGLGLVLGPFLSPAMMSSKWFNVLCTSLCSSGKWVMERLQCHSIYKLMTYCLESSKQSVNGNLHCWHLYGNSLIKPEP